MYFIFRQSQYKFQYYVLYESFRTGSHLLSKNSFVQEVDNHLDRDSDISNFRIENNVIFKKNIIFGSYLVKPVTFNDSKNILSTLSKGSITHRKKPNKTTTLFSSIKNKTLTHAFQNMESTCNKILKLKKKI